MPVSVQIVGQVAGQAVWRVAFARMRSPATELSRAKVRMHQQGSRAWRNITASRQRRRWPDNFLTGRI